MIKKRRSSVALLVGLLLALVALAPATTSAGVMRGMLFHDGDTVRTLVNPSRLPHGGTDPLYMVVGGVQGQLGIAGLAPGEPGYSGGDWAVYVVTWNTAPYLLTSDEAVMDAEDAGDVTVTRDSGRDFRCPIQP